MEKIYEKPEIENFPVEDVLYNSVSVMEGEDGKKDNIGQDIFLSVQQ